VYPFEPRSIAYLKPGQFWSIALSDGTIGCGRVLGFPSKESPLAPTGTKIFLAGLMDWKGAGPPTAESIGGSKVIAQGWAHIKAILDSGGQILGHRELDPVADGLAENREVSHRGGGIVWLYEGATLLRPATDEERLGLKVRGTWGTRVFALTAEHRLVKSRRSDES